MVCRKRALLGDQLAMHLAAELEQVGCDLLVRIGQLSRTMLVPCIELFDNFVGNLAVVDDVEHGPAHAVQRFAARGDLGEPLALVFVIAEMADAEQLDHQRQGQAEPDQR